MPMPLPPKYSYNYGDRLMLLLHKAKLLHLLPLSIACRFPFLANNLLTFPQKKWFVSLDFHLHQKSAYPRYSEHRPSHCDKCVILLGDNLLNPHSDPYDLQSRSRQLQPQLLSCKLFQVEN